MTFILFSKLFRHNGCRPELNNQIAYFICIIENEKCSRLLSSFDFSWKNLCGLLLQNLRITLDKSILHIQYNGCVLNYRQWKVEKLGIATWAKLRWLSTQKTSVQLELKTKKKVIMSLNCWLWVHFRPKNSKMWTD